MEMSSIRERKLSPISDADDKIGGFSTFSQVNKAKETDKYDHGSLRKPVFSLLKVILVVTVILHVIAPLLLLTNPWILSKMVFLNMFRWPPFIDVTQPEDFGLVGVRNFYLEVEENRIGVCIIISQTELGKYANILVGKGTNLAGETSRYSVVNIRHIPPADIAASRVDYIQYEQLLDDGRPIFLYLHGTSGTRAGWHRVQLYKLLVSMDFHVITMDYRGYADSTGTPSEDGVVSDSYFMYKWIKQRSGSSPVYLWGHSLGTAITTKLAKYLCDKGEEPLGVVLESPFTNIREAASFHPFTAPYRFLPWFEPVFLDTIGLNDINFTSDISIASVTTPLLIMHAEDDLVVPFVLGKKLYEIAADTRPRESGPVDFVSFNASYGYGHKLIFKAPELPNVIRKFMKTCQG